MAMHAMVLRSRGGPLILEERPEPTPGAGEMRIRVEACAICRWEERQLVTVANLTRRDAAAFLPLAQQAHIKTSTTRYPLRAANEAVSDLRNGRVQGAAVLVPENT